MATKDSFHLESARLVLRRLTEADVESLLAYRNDPEVARYQSWSSITRTQALALIQELQTVPPGTPGAGFQIAIALKETGQHIGDCYLHREAEETYQAEIGYTLAPAFQGQGYAREAVSRLLDFVFTDLNLHRVFARTLTYNRRSINLLARLGMRREAHFIRDYWFKEKWEDEYLYAILQDEWQRARS